MLMLTGACEDQQRCDPHPLYGIQNIHGMHSRHRNSLHICCTLFVRHGIPLLTRQWDPNIASLLAKKRRDTMKLRTGT